MDTPSGPDDGAMLRPLLRSVPTGLAGRTAAADGPVVETALEVAEALCGRAVVGGEETAPAPYGEVALALRDLVPAVDDAEFDRHMSGIARAAWLVTVAETADADEPAFAEAAWAAGLDRVEFDLGDEGDAEFRATIVAHWDDELRDAVARLVAADAPGEVASSSTSNARSA